MYTLHVVASERRLSQVSLQRAIGNDGSQRRTTSRAIAQLGEDDSFSDSEEELLGLDLEGDSQIIEFTAGNPRVEHITGVVHLYRPTPGRLSNVASSPTASTTVTPGLQQSSSPITSALPALINAPPPTKAHASWASLLGAPAPSSTKDTAAASGRVPPPQQSSVVGVCNELCCLALPSDMTIADFCTFLGAHLLRLRRMRVLRRQVGPTTHVIASLAAMTSTSPPPLPLIGLPTRSAGTSTSTSRSVSGGGSGSNSSGSDDAPSEGGDSRRPVSDAQPSSTSASVAVSQDGQAAASAGVCEVESRQRRGVTGGPQQGVSAEGTTEVNLNGDQNATQEAAAPKITSSGGTGPGSVLNHKQPQASQEPQQLRQQLTTLGASAAAAASGAAAAAAPPRPQLQNPQAPPSQRVVCMVLMRMESPEAADELYNDLNGKPFSSLEPDIVCRLVHVRHVEVTSGGGKHAVTDSVCNTLTVATAGGSPDDLAAPDSAAAAAAPPLHAPPPGQTELPTCPVCLERLDEHVSGIVTTVCNHMFHSECLQKWADTTCPVCRYCVQGAANTSRCGVCSTAVDLWICLICGHVGCGRYRAGHAADHWRTSGHCYALELETQRVWDYVGDNYVHRLIQSKTDGKLVELAAPATAVASPHAAGRGPGGGHRYQHHHHYHDAEYASCGAAAGSGGRDGSVGGLRGIADGGGASGSGGPDGGGGPGWSNADEQLKEALMASKLDAIAVEYNHLLASQLDSQRQYYEGLVSQATLDADHRCAQAGAAVDKARAETEEAQAVVKEETRRRHAAERRATETAEALKSVRQEVEFLQTLNETLLANQRDFKQQLAAEKARADAAEAAVRELQEQVRDLAFFIEAQRTISEAAGGELREGTVLPLRQNNSSRRGRGSSSSSRTGNRIGPTGGGSRSNGDGR